MKGGEMIKLFASDFDNTLARHGFVSMENQKGIRILKDQGIDFCICSGRILSNLRGINRHYSFHAHLVGTNGSVVQTNEGKILGKKSFSLKQVKEILTLAREHHWYFFVYDQDTCYIPKERIKMISQTPLKNMISRFVHTKIYAIDYDFEPFISQSSGALKINIYPRKNELLLAKDILLNFKDVYITTASDNKYELMSSKVNKWEGIKVLAQELGIKEDEIAVIGDYDNDLPMIRSAKIGFAAKRANPRVLKECDLRVDSVYEAIKEVINYNWRQSNE